MTWKILQTQRWPLWVRLAVVAAVLVVVFLFQIPLEREVPGEPFLLFFLVVIGATLAFGKGVGLVSVAISSLLSTFFFEPFGSLAIHQAGDVIKIELYAILAGAAVMGFAALAETLIMANEKTRALERADASKAVLLRELAHGVANNFASVAALISIRSAAVSDSDAKSVLDDAIEQVAVMARVHRQLRSGVNGVFVDSASFIQELCEDLNASAARGRPLSVLCTAESHALAMDQAVLIGLIINELVTNAIKHAFPHDRAGHIRVAFGIYGRQLHLTVADDGIGLTPVTERRTGTGQELVRGLAHQLDGDLQVQSSAAGSTFRLSVPYERPLAAEPRSHHAANLIH